MRPKSCLHCVGPYTILSATHSPIHIHSGSGSTTSGKGYLRLALSCKARADGLSAALSESLSVAQRHVSRAPPCELNMADLVCIRDMQAP